MKEKLDRLWSLAVRTRDRFQCQKYPCPANGKYMQGAHIRDRNHLWTRWDVKNGITMCFYHHLRWAHRCPVEFTEWVKKRIGSRRFYALREKADNRSNETMTMEEMKKIEKKLLKQIKKFEEHNANEPF